MSPYFDGWFVEFLESDLKKIIGVHILLVDLLSFWKVDFRQIRCACFGGWIVEFFGKWLKKNYGCAYFAGWFVEFPESGL